MTTTVTAYPDRGKDYRETVTKDSLGRETYVGNTLGLAIWTTYDERGNATYHAANPSH